MKIFACCVTLLISSFAMVQNEDGQNFSFLPNALKVKMDEAAQLCMAEGNVTKDNLHNILEGINNSKDANCTIFCISKRLGLLEPSGHVDDKGYAKFIGIIQNESPGIHCSLLWIYNNCKIEVKESRDPCLNAHDLYMCFRRNARRLYSHEEKPVELDH